MHAYRVSIYLSMDTTQARKKKKTLTTLCIYPEIFYMNRKPKEKKKEMMPKTEGLAKQGRP